MRKRPSSPERVSGASSTAAVSSAAANGASRSGRTATTEIPASASPSTPTARPVTSTVSCAVAASDSDKPTTTFRHARIRVTIGSTGGGNTLVPG
jgi:hypothetical protein